MEFANWNIRNIAKEGRLGKEFSIKCGGKNLERVTKVFNIWELLLRVMKESD